MKIKTKVIVVFLVSSLGLVGIIGLINIYQSNKIIRNEVEEKLFYLAQSHGNRIDQSLEKVNQMGNHFSTSIINLTDLDRIQKDKEYFLNYKRNEMDNLVKNFARLDDTFGAYFYFNPNLLGEAHDVWYRKTETGTYKKQPEAPKEYYSRSYPWNHIQGKYSNVNMDWYYEPIDKGRAVWSDLYGDWVDDSVRTLSYTKAVYKDNTLLGVAGMDINFNKIRKAIEKIEVYDNGYAFLLDKDYNFLVHPEYSKYEKLDNLVNEKVFKHLSENKNGILNYSLGGPKLVVAYTELLNGWTLCVAVPREEIFAERFQLIYLIGGLIIISGFIALLLSHLLKDKIFNPVEKAVGYCQQVAEGDFSFTIDENFLNRKDEVGDLAKGLKSIKANLQDMIQDLKDKNQRLKKVSIIDQLTGIYNRRKLESILEELREQTLRYNKEFAIIILDLDHFSDINDNFGHLEGDHVLEKVASLIQENIREVDSCGRWGGEEFLIICPEVGLEDSYKLATRLRKLISEADFSPVPKVTASFGVASYLKGDEIDTIIERADKGLYKAKELGRNREETIQEKMGEL
ncbi:diguanylate cyclase [Halanaerobacter jeridensis]|uniref:Diguanylate cyclase (GGDEF)-like protein n=1 Tax=Halanaerobacter jeridensis TaxID=706427 RepID=A0A939BMK4_9FIRM|nr:diguanylate cyclase [Halanaerobacter jeridensis]MBM7556775.1 diguanylate cyclase (GGDEF)-like protein [Halanaerobacter jeridensis]